MHLRRTIALLAALLLWLPLTLAACSGGSGSSGFDAAPQSENAAITQALDQQRCVTHENLQICPVGPQPANSAHAPHVGTGLDGATFVACTSTAGSSACSFVLPFTPDGFAPTTAFGVAVRTVSPDGPWQIAGTALANGASGAPEFDVPVSVEAPSNAPSPSGHVQVAILAFLQAPSSLPGHFEDLSDSGADFAFVTNELSVQFAGPPAAD